MKISENYLLLKATRIEAAFVSNQSTIEHVTSPIIITCSIDRSNEVISYVIID